MDAAGIDVQVLSLTSPGTEQLEATEAAALAREANDLLGEAVRRHPSRFAGLAALPTAAPTPPPTSWNVPSVPTPKEH
jgi:predicted TIM-barrel fold metal-dependent hydrolase